MMLDPRAIAHALGGQVAGRDTVLAPGPGHSARDRSLAVRLDPAAPDGFLCYSHSNDDWRACRDHVRQHLGLPAWEPGDGQQRTVSPQHVEKWDLATIEAEANEGPRAWTEDEVLRIAAARRIWDEARDPRGTVAETYLKSRALSLDDDVAGSVLRFHSACPWRDENAGRIIFIPALIAAFTSLDGGEVTGVHRIRVDRPERWPKTDRRMLGVVHRAAVMLNPLGDVLTIGEGVETCLAARQLGYRPAWALGSVGAISFFPLIKKVKRLRILAETGDASKRATRLCGRRWHGAGRKVQIIRPDAGHDDLNDELMAKAMS
jgi:putative DNA primase/helicase